MATNLILNVTNFNDSSLTNGKEYGLGGNYACNYPVDALTSFTITATIGSIYITTSTGDFTDLLGCDIQNNNTPVRAWITGAGGEILEIDYVISATRAALKAPSSYTLAGVVFVAVNYWGSISVLSTTLANTDGFGAVNLPANSKIGPLALKLGANQEIQMGSEPITVDLGSAGAGCQLTIKYQ